MMSKGRMSDYRSVAKDDRGFARAMSFALLVLLGLTALPASAQFSGPPVPDATPINLPTKLTTDPALLYPRSRPFRIGPGDTIVIHLFGVPDFASPQQVTVDGMLQVPLVGGVPVGGMTLSQAGQAVEDKLRSAGMYREPHVMLQMTESPNQVVTVTGEMHGVIPITPGRTLISVLAAAGPFPPTASHKITIDRQGVNTPIVVDLGPDPAHAAYANIPMFPGDTVIVPMTGSVYLLGAFKTPKEIPISPNSPLTLMQAAAQGGGPMFEGSYKDLRIIRTEGLERKVVRVDMKRVMRGKDPDPILQPDDIVLLPSNVFKTVLTNGGFGAITSLGSLLVIAFETR